MKVTDVIAESLHERGVNHVFGLTGGAVVHLFDSVCKRPDMKAIFTHHEQAASFACVAYGRVRDGVGVGMFTTGPGGTNALTGLAGAWVDSIASVFISGQARKEHLSRGTGTRQVGTQELDILAMAEPVTKRAAMLQNAEDILYELDLAFHTASTGRPGPVWLDIPLNLQWANVEKEKLRRFAPPNETAKAPDLSTVSRMIRAAKRPLFVLGSGLQNETARRSARKFVAALGIPYVVTFRSFGHWPYADPMNLGVLGIAGNRGANLAVYNADLIVAVGNHLPMPTTGGQFQSWAPNAKRVVVNIDEKQLAFETVRIDEKIHMDACAFFEAMNEEFKTVRPEWDRRWIELVPLWRAASDADVLAADPTTDRPDQYLCVRALSDLLKGGENIVVDGGGTNVYITHQGFKVKPDQRVMLTSSLGAMGSGFPEALGAYFANGRPTVCLVGDGSFMLNVQELSTIRRHNIPMKIFVFNNGGYVSIRETQSGFLGGRFAGSAEEGGLHLPSFTKVSEAFEIPAMQITDRSRVASEMAKFLAWDGPGLCEIVLSPLQAVRPRQDFAPRPDGTNVALPLNQMFPPLPDDKLRALSPWTVGAGRG